jgi:RNA polymerase sigma-70 factor (ECF subfamily)
MAHNDNDSRLTAQQDFELLVSRYYSTLYQFAFSLTRNEDDACDLTQQTFYTWARKGHQLRDPSKVKTWLFTTLYHEFLEKRRRQVRFPHHELSEVNQDLPNIAPTTVNELDAATVLQSLARLDQTFQAPVALFYLEEHSYKEIADILGVPLGTVKSRISRGIAQLHHLLTHAPPRHTASGKRPKHG